MSVSVETNLDFFKSIEKNYLGSLATQIENKGVGSGDFLKEMQRFSRFNDKDIDQRINADKRNNAVDDIQSSSRSIEVDRSEKNVNARESRDNVEDNDISDKVFDKEPKNEIESENITTNQNNASKDKEVDNQENISETNLIKQEEVDTNTENEPSLNAVNDNFSDEVGSLTTEPGDGVNNEENNTNLSLELGSSNFETYAPIAETVAATNLATASLQNSDQIQIKTAQQQNSGDVSTNEDLLALLQKQSGQNIDSSGLNEGELSNLKLSNQEQLQASAGNNAQNNGQQKLSFAEIFSANQNGGNKMLANAGIMPTQNLAQNLSQSLTNSSSNLQNSGQINLNSDFALTSNQNIQQGQTIARESAQQLAKPHAPVPYDKVGIEIAARIKDGAKRFEIRLDPPELGRIDVRLEFDQDGGTTTKLFVEKSETLDLLQRDARVLEKAMREAGLDENQTSLEFSLKDNSQDQNRQNSSHNSAREHSSDEDYQKSRIEIAVPDSKVVSVISDSKIDVTI